MGTCFFEVCYNLNDGSFPNGLALAFIVMLMANLSGGHANPATTLASYIHNEPWGDCKSILKMFSIMLGQLFGAFAGLGISYLLRTQVVLDEETNESIYVPDQNAFYPRILD